MYLKIGFIIKRLRMENNVTQDTLANAVGVTPQAISRWESEGGYPDIELLPLLADFFSVSTDELLGYKLSEREEELEAIKREMERLSEVGTLEERISYARNALSRYPFEWKIKENLAYCLFYSWLDTRNDSFLTEAEALCKSIIEECKDEDTRCRAIDTLISIYRETKRTDKALETVNLLVPMKYCREFAKSSGIGDGNTEVYIQDEIDKLTDCLGTAITNYVLAEDLPNDASTWDRKIGMLQISNELYRMIYGEDMMFYHVRLSGNYWLISTFQMSSGKEEEALNSLESMCHHAVEYDKSYRRNHGKNYSSVFTDKLIYPEPGKEFHELKEHTECYDKLERLQNKRYDSIRGSERFIAVVNALKEYAK